MTKGKKLKAISWEEYKLTPFFFREYSSEGTRRFVIWTSNLLQLKQLVYKILQIFPNNVEILLKIEREDTDKEKKRDKWIRYYGKSSLQKLLKAIKSNKEYVFQDGRNQLCVKRLDADEYIALDDHDILYIYSNSEKFAKLCKKIGFEERKEKLIYEEGHWHISSKDGDKLKDKFIKELELNPTS